ncbi:MAG: oleate hydratase, partial [Thermoplasmatota archaeon]
GDYVDKKMKNCTGREILEELCYHLECEDELPSILDDVECKPCNMPFITAHFMPRSEGDRPKVVPDNSNNLAFLGQYTEIPYDVVFTVEYSIRSAQKAVYELLDVDREIPTVSKHYMESEVIAKTLDKLMP